MKKLLLLLLFPLICFGQTNPNIYIDQAGSGNSFTVTQDYTGNYASIISGSQSPADYNTYNITQQGDRKSTRLNSSHIPLSRNDGSDMVSVNVPRDQDSVMYMTQNGVTIKNRVNSNNPSTIIITKQN